MFPGRIAVDLPLYRDMRDKPQGQQAIAELATEQHGIVTARQLASLGYSGATIWRFAASGRLHRLHRGVYAVGHTSLSRQGQCLAAVLGCDGALLSHRSAAWLWGITTRWEQLIEVTVAVPRRSRPEVRVHSGATLVATDRDRSEGVPVTAVPRTLLDFAAVNPRFLGWALDRTERLGLLDLIAMDALLARSSGLRGVARLRTALDIYRIPGFVRSGLERRFLQLVRDAGLPRPSTNHFIAGYELDAYWPTERFAVELDTYDYHGSHAAFEADRVRQEGLKLAGIEMIRITGVRMDREPKTVQDHLRRLLAERSHALQRSRG